MLSDISSLLKIGQSHFEKSGNESVDCKEPLCTYPNVCFKMFRHTTAKCYGCYRQISCHENRKELGFVFSHRKFTVTFILQQFHIQQIQVTKYYYSCSMAMLLCVFVLTCFYCLIVWLFWLAYDVQHHILFQ